MSFVRVIVNGMAIGIVGGKVVSMDPFHESDVYCFNCSSWDI